MWWRLSSEAPDSFSPKEHTFGFIQVCVSSILRSRISCFFICHLLFLWVRQYTLASPQDRYMPADRCYSFARERARGARWADLSLAEIVHQQSLYPFPLKEAQPGFTSQAPLGSLCLHDQAQARRTFAEALRACLQAKALRSTWPFPLFATRCWLGAVTVRPGGMAATQNEGSQTSRHTKESWPPARVPLRDYYKEWEVGSVWLEELCYLRSFSYPSPAYPNSITAPGCLENHKSQMTVQSSEVKLKWSIWLTRTRLNALKISPNY